MLKGLDGHGNFSTICTSWKKRVNSFLSYGNLFELEWTLKIKFGLFFLLYISHYSLCYSASPLLFRKKAMNKQTRVDISGSHRSGLLIIDIWSLSLFDGASTVTLPTPHAPDPLSHLMAITVPLRAINTP